MLISMKELRIFLATLCITYLAAFSLTTFASDEASESHTTSRSEYRVSDDDGYEHQTEKKREIAKKNKERLEKLRKRAKKIVRVTPKTPVAPVVPAKPTTPVVPATPAKPATPATPVAPAAPVATAVTKTSTVSYRTPAGSDAITFTATVKAGVITAASSVTKAQNGTSIWYQDTFAGKVSQAVVGKKIAGLNLSAIGGASLTTTAFEQFIANLF